MPHKVPRWVSSVVILIIYTIRVFILQGWYIVSYALAIYLLNLFIAFISPKFDPMMEDDEEIGETSSPATYIVCSSLPHTHTHTQYLLINNHCVEEGTLLLKIEHLNSLPYAPYSMLEVVSHSKILLFCVSFSTSIFKQ